MNRLLWSVENFKPAHLDGIGLSEEYLNFLQKDNESLTVFVGDEILYCCGMLRIHENRAVVWLVLNRRAKSRPRAILLSVSWFIKTCRIKRLEAYVNSADPIAIKFIERLGFDKEGVMRCSSESGEDQLLYARIRP